MKKFKLFLILIAYVANLVQLEEISCDDDCTDIEIEKFDDFKRNFSKFYFTEESECDGRAIFCQNYRVIVEHNANKSASYKMTLTADMDREDGDRKKATGLKLEKENKAKNVTAKDLIKSASKVVKSSAHGIVKAGSNGPVEINNGPLTGPVKDQGNCGSCWTFCAIATLQYQAKLYHNQSLVLSEQDIIDCNAYGRECAGGDPTISFNYAYQNGVASQTKYPYHQLKSTSCKRSKAVSTAYKADWAGCSVQPNGNEATVKSIIDNMGVVATAIGTNTNFMSYASGVFDDPSCPKTMMHCVAIVGYGTDAKSGLNYWMVKNSWGKLYGENGYVRMRRGTNMCGIESTYLWMPCPK